MRFIPHPPPIILISRIHSSHQCPNSSSSKYHVRHSSSLIYYHIAFTHTPRPISINTHTSPQKSNITTTIITHKTPITTAIPHPFSHPTYNYTDKRGPERDIYTLLVLCDIEKQSSFDSHTTSKLFGSLFCKTKKNNNIKLNRSENWVSEHF